MSQIAWTQAVEEALGTRDGLDIFLGASNQALQNIVVEVRGHLISNNVRKTNQTQLVFLCRLFNKACPDLDVRTHCY